MSFLIFLLRGAPRRLCIFLEKPPQKQMYKYYRLSSCSDTCISTLQPLLTFFEHFPTTSPQNMRLHPSLGIHFFCFFWANLKIAQVITSKIHIGLKQKKFTFVFLAKVKLSNLQQTPQYLLVPPHSLRKFNSIFQECCVARHAGRLFSGRSHRLSLMSFPGILMLLTVA